MTRQDPSTEPARQTPYRRLYTKLYSFQDEIARQNSCITFLLNEIRALQKRVDKLEKHRANTAAADTSVAGESLERL